MAGAWVGNGQNSPVTWRTEPAKASFGGFMVDRDITRENV